MTAGDAVECLWGCGDPDALFRGGDRAMLPWRRFPRRRTGEDERFSVPAGRPVLDEVDPRSLVATQAWLVRHHALHYMTGEWERSGTTSADMASAANRYPVVTVDDMGSHVIRTGHHRSFAALIEGRPLTARVFAPHRTAASGPTAEDRPYVVTVEFQLGPRHLDANGEAALEDARQHLADIGLDEAQILDRLSMATSGRTTSDR